MLKRFLLAVALSGVAVAGPARPPAAEREPQSAIQTGPGGMVSAADPRAAEAGVEILRAGGSAADAAAATMLALTVVEPQSSGIGGGGFLVYHDQASHNVTTSERQGNGCAGIDACTGVCAIVIAEAAGGDGAMISKGVAASSDGVVETTCGLSVAAIGSACAAGDSSGSFTGVLAARPMINCRLMTHQSKQRIAGDNRGMQRPSSHSALISSVACADVQARRTSRVSARMWIASIS